MEKEKRLLIEKLEKKSSQIRKRLIDMCIKTKTGHLSSSLSCVEILVTLYYGGILKHNPSEPMWSERDRFILSKGHAAPLLYIILEDLGYFSKEELEKFVQPDGRLGTHPQNDISGVEVTTGSLAQGFGIAAGIALGAKMNRDFYLVFTLLGDGECYEGAVWETALFAAHYRLNNLIAIIDRNYMCVTDFTENAIELEPLEDKWKSFGWNVVKIDGHSILDLYNVLYPLRGRISSKPTVIIAETIKGKGVEPLCFHPLSHGKIPSEKNLRKVKRRNNLK